LGNLKVIFGEDYPLPTSGEMDTVLSQVDNKTNTPNQLVAKLIQLLETFG
jgi:hypothetical protein